MRTVAIKSKLIRVHTSQLTKQDRLCVDLINQPACEQKGEWGGERSLHMAELRKYSGGGEDWGDESPSAFLETYTGGSSLKGGRGGWVFGRVGGRRPCQLVWKPRNVSLCPVKSVQKHITGCFTSLMLLESVQLLSIWSRLQTPPDTIKGHVSACVCGCAVILW